MPSISAFAIGDSFGLPDHLIAFVAIAFISILARRLKRLVTDDLSA